jgi:hypothetical protein
MAITDHVIGSSLRGHIGKEVVFKRYKKKTVVSKFPDMSNIKPTASQKKRRKLFANAVAYAKKKMSDREVKNEYTKKWRKKGRTAYHALIKEYFQKIATEALKH